MDVLLTGNGDITAGSGEGQGRVSHRVTPAVDWKQILVTRDP
jgi:hypothetical protein